MSTNEKDPSKTPTTIKIAAKDASKRATNGGADPGPGDMSAEPSEMPEPVNVPRPPTESELVVKSVKTGGSRQIKTINDPVSLPKSRKSSASTKLSGTGAGSGGASQVQTAKTGSGGGGPASGAGGGSRSGGSKLGGGASGGGGGGGSKSGGGASGAGPEGSAGGPTSKAAFEGSEKGVTESAGAGPGGASSMGAMATQKTASGQQGAALHSDTQSGASGGPGQEHDEEEEGEGEVETGPSPSPSPGPSGASGADPSGTQPTSPDVGGPPSGGVDSAPASSGGGSSKMSPKTSAVSKKSAPGHSKTVSASSASSASSHGSSHHSHHGHGHGHGHGKKKKKVTKFRYHKRITVRTHGKTSPSTIMHKVNKKDHKAGITPSTIEDMDTEELMKRAGIKGKKGTHWRVRLRQTKRITQGGKTVVQTKIAYRDSEGHKKVRTSLTPDCKQCGKKLEDCKCDEK